MSPPRHAAPPAWASRLVRLAIRDPRWRDVTLGDLAEEFESRLASDGTRRARAWYAGQARTLAWTALGDATRDFLKPAGGSLMSSLIREVRIAFRTLVRQPMTTLLVVATLALGLGVNAATFGMIDALALRPFTFPGVDRLVVLSENTADNPFPQEAVSPGTFGDLKARPLTTLDGLAAMEWWDVDVSGGSEPERVLGTKVSASFFAMLGQAPGSGRFFVPDDEPHGNHRVVVMSHGLWTRRFGADPDLVGRSIRLDGESYTVVGIARPRFDFPNGTELWTPLTFTADEAARRRQNYLTVIGQLAGNARREDAQAEVAPVYAAITQQFPVETRGRSLVVRGFSAAMIDFGLSTVLALWQAAAIFVLVIACVNVANLLLAQGAERRRELAVRLAIGAGRAQVVRQLLIESAVLATLAVPAALGVAWVATASLRTLLPATLIRFVPGWTEMGVDWRVTLVTFAAAFTAAVIFGLLPALQVSRPDLTAALRDGGRSQTSGGAKNRLRRALVVAEIALALPLLVMAGLAAVGAHRFAAGAQGYEPEGVVRLRMILPEATYPDGDARRRFVSALLDEAARVPRAEVVGTTSTTPASTGGGQRREVAIDGRPVPDGDLPRVNSRVVSSGYFATMRIPIEEGRAIDAQDQPDSQRVVVISRSLARRHFPDRSALGQRIKFGRESTEWHTVIGIAGDTIDDWFQYRHEPTVYLAVHQAPTSQVFLVARAPAGVDPALLVPELRAAVASVDPAQAVFDVATMPGAIRERTTGIRVVAVVMAVFGGLAMALAAFGIYGIMSHYVAMRRPEIGVRVALGATSRDILRLTLGHSTRLAAIGIGIGLGLAVALARLMETLLFGVVAVEPALFASIAGGLAVLAIVASAVPARRAISVDPITAMRD